ncbi:CAP domain-containing protein [Sphingomonas rhizophila]|nr:CAP domain-containing protein [Sphingomonas rhizophila]
MTGLYRSIARRGALGLAAIAAVTVAVVPSVTVSAATISRTETPPSYMMNAAFVQDTLALHNSERARMGVAPLAWDPELARAAAAYADELARKNDFRHSPMSARPNQGENLWMGTRGAYSTQEKYDGWLSEKSLYRAGVFPNVSRNGNWAAVGHYTQMVWSGSQRVGCAIRSSGSSDVLVCRYFPAGNVMGRAAV